MFVLYMASIIEKPKVEIAEDLLLKLETFVQTEGQVIVHCLCKAPIMYDTKIRIWKTTYLFANNSDHKSILVHAENICYYPAWQDLPAGSSTVFTLIFNRLPKSCTIFDFMEVIPESGGFSVKGIARNKTDVYFIRLV